jgi:hypothetical protein
MIAGLRRGLARITTHLVWLAGSTAGLAAAHAIDPYVFGFATMACLEISLVVATLTAVLATHALPWALLATAPAVIALGLLSTFRWA